MSIILRTYSCTLIGTIRKHDCIALILIALLCTESVAACDCNNGKHNFNNRFNLSMISNTQVLVKNKTDIKEKDSRVSINEYFNWPADRHSKTRYQFISIENNFVKIKYDYSEDTRGIGGKMSM